MGAKWPGRGHAGTLAWLVEGLEGSEPSHRSLPRPRPRIQSPIGYRFIGYRFVSPALPNAQRGENRCLRGHPSPRLRLTPSRRRGYGPRDSSSSHLGADVARLPARGCLRLCGGLPAWAQSRSPGGQAGRNWRHGQPFGQRNVSPSRHPRRGRVRSFRHVRGPRSKTRCIVRALTSGATRRRLSMWSASHTTRMNYGSLRVIAWPTEKPSRSRL